MYGFYYTIGLFWFCRDILLWNILVLSIRSLEHKHGGRRGILGNEDRVFWLANDCNDLRYELRTKIGYSLYLSNAVHCSIRVVLCDAM
jgi:hypothetical protein